MNASVPQAAVGPLLHKLGHFVRLSEDDRAALQALCATRVRHYPARADLVREGDTPRVIRMVLDGWACRTRTLEDGRQQVVGLFLPGDLCDLNVYILREMDHTITALSPVTVAEVTREAFDEAMLGHPRLLHAIWWESLVTTAIQREWIVNLGARDAFERMMHLFCETFIRMRAAGLTSGASCAFPLTQVVMADVTGLSFVHVNRTLQSIRETGLVELSDRILTIPNLGAAMSAALFNPAYLHLDHEGSQLDANG
jgi:CRP-like cAMP-binding protein